MRTEILSEWFFPAEIKNVGGIDIPTASASAEEKYRKLKEDWLINHPRMPREIPMVSLSPKKIDGNYQISIRTEIIYK